MNTPLPMDKVIEVFPFVNNSQALKEALIESCSIVKLPKGSFICMEGNQCTLLPLVLSGTARIYKFSESGREITLYRLDRGQSCILTASCILAEIDFPAFAIAETDIEALAVPTVKFQLWMDEFAGWRSYVFTMLANRLSTVISVVEEIAFRDMDSRLSNYLLIQADTDLLVIPKTHETIASDLGTSREVVSRLLKGFEREGLD